MAWAWLLAIAVLGLGCGRSPTGPIHDFGNNDPNVFVAFGDSITSGTGDTGSDAPDDPSCVLHNTEFGYPPRLATLLGATVINEGVCGDTSGGGAARVQSVLSRHRPGYLLILFSPNDLFTPMDTIIENLRFIIQAAKDNKTIPIIGTLTPAFYSHRGWEPFIEALNPRIVQLANEEGIQVADHWTAFNMDASLLTEDGLHPNARGYEVMARTWYEAILNVP